MRSIANTTLSLGLVNAPVKLYPATHNNDVKLTLAASDGAPVEQVYRRADTREVVGSVAACERAYNGRVVNMKSLSLIDEECAIEDGINLKKSLSIRHFIPMNRIPFNRVEKWYYVAPDGNQDKSAYATMARAMEDKQAGAVVKVMLRNRQHMMVIYPNDGALYGVILAYADEVNPLPEECEQAKAIAVNPAFVQVAEQLIDAAWDEDAVDIDTMTDTAVAKRQELLASILAGEKIKRAPVAAEAPVAPDLYDALKATLDQIKPANGKVKAKVRKKVTT